MTAGQPSALAAALAKVQSALPEIHKDRTAKVETRGGGSYKYSYADLSAVTKAIMPILGANGLAWVTRPTLTTEGRFVLAYELRHTSGEAVSGEYPLPANGSPQELGSAISYGRRYSLCCVTGVAPESDDDDAAAASAEPRRQARRTSRDTTPSTSRDDQESETRTPGLMTDAQRRRLMQLFNQAGIKDRGERLAHCGAAIGRDVASSAELTTREAALIISGLEQVIAERPGADEVPS
jgi:hypothetical protein